ncbi:MAG TPA: sigma-70 family RNA polymerase sigma factor [Polyangiaceae bacterium]|nr:sigma-70 family RNA polymerase sigma factor [Polyangiaceae bacterium]
MAPAVADEDLARTIAESGASAAQAEAELCRRYAARVRLYGLKHLQSAAAADDLVQLVMMRVLEAIRAKRVEDPTQLPSFIFGTCRLVSAELRRAEERQGKIARANEGLRGDVEPPQYSERDLVRLFGCLGKLPEREANVLRMSFMEDRAAEEVCERLGVTAGNLRVLRCRALAKVALCMGEVRP